MAFYLFNTLLSLLFIHPICPNLTSSPSSHFSLSFPLSLLLSHSVPTDELDGVRGHHEDDAIDGERGEDEEEGRAEEEQLDFGGDDDDAVVAATSASALVTNLLPLEAPLPATSSTQGPLELTNPGSELTSLGKITG